MRRFIVICSFLLSSSLFSSDIIQILKSLTENLEYVSNVGEGIYNVTLEMMPEVLEVIRDASHSIEWGGYAFGGGMAFFGVCYLSSHIIKCYCHRKQMTKEPEEVYRQFWFDESSTLENF